MASVNEDFLSNMIKHKVMLERLSSGLANRVISKIIDRIKKDIVLPDDISILSEIQVIALSTEIEKKVNDIIVIEYDNMESELKDVAIYEQRYIQNTVVRTVPAGLAINAIEMNNTQLIETLKTSDNVIVKDVFTNLANKTSKNYKEVIMNGYRQGTGVKEVARRLYNLESQGLEDATELKKLKNNIRTLSRTATNSINAEVNKEFFNANDQILRGYLFVATLDGRTSTICGSQDGKFFEKGQEPNLPLHYNCRSVLSPVLKSSDNLNLEGTRRSMDGLVPKSESYETWLRKQDRGFIDEVLGEKKAKLFINEGISLERFVDIESGKKYSLREIARRENIDISDFSFKLN